MRNQLVGDFGDFVKYALLQALSQGRQLGVAWYLRPNENNNDGSHTKYLCEQSRWRHLNPPLFDALREIVFGGAMRSVARIQNRRLLPGATYSRQVLASNVPPGPEREQWRHGWFTGVIEDLAHCNMVFADPDNSLCYVQSFDPNKLAHWKRMPLDEACRLAFRRTTIIYHHNSRFTGGHHKEIRYWMERLPGCDYAFYSSLYSSQRTFFVLNPDSEIVERLRQFADNWEAAGSLMIND